MDRLQSRPNKGFPGGKSLAAFAGVVCTVIAALVATVLALAVAASVVVVALIGGVLLFLASLAMRARRTARSKAAASDPGPQILEARHVGGHSWVAYGWDQRQ
jgi:threonine/homoserine/homoserine lactone efflux protein